MQTVMSRRSVALIVGLFALLTLGDTATATATSGSTAQDTTEANDRAIDSANFVQTIDNP